jgi:BON domain
VAETQVALRPHASVCGSVPTAAALAASIDRFLDIPDYGALPMNPIGKVLITLMAAFSLVAASGCASTPTQESTGEYVDDSMITAKVKSASLNEPTLNVAEINVETFKGTVQLSGFVASQAAATKAVEVTRAVGGVKSVKNDMSIK